MPSDSVVCVRLSVDWRCMSGDRWFSGDVAENSLQPGTDLACDRRERGVSDHAKHLLGRDGTHIGLPVENKHRDVARQQRAKLWLRGQGLVRKLGIAGAEDRVRLSLDTELGGKSGLASISDRTPNPSSASAARVLASASSKLASRARHSE